MPTDVADLEPPLTLDEPSPRVLGTWDQTVLWGNLGISILLPVTATFLLLPGMSLLAALGAIVVGTLLGNVLLGLAAQAGAETGAPAMVLLRGLFGRRGSYVPTALNLAQCLGWSTFEIVIIAETADRVVGGGWRWPFVLMAGAFATLMAIRPLTVVRVLRKITVWLVIASTIYLLVRVGGKDIGSFTHGGWGGFWQSTDLVLALAVSWTPLAADYTRHARSGRSAFIGAAAGYGSASAVFFALGVLALAGMKLTPGNDVIDALLALPAGWLALIILVVDEVDEAFANVYSTAISAQNVLPRLDRRVLAVVVGVSATLLALVFNIQNYESFLFLIGSVFVPLFATFAVDYFVLRHSSWDVSEDAPTRWEMFVPWIAGFVTYQLINPGTVGWWQGWWVARAHDIGFTPSSWMSATIASFAVAAVLTLIVGSLRRGQRDRGLVAEAEAVG
ncbi:MAG: nucleobase:cation symporter, family [Actinomycetota bacterium]|nr:nucleobase:cation symporter, family [Actinomycetota bacterium]